MAIKKARKTQRTVVFEVRTTRPLPVGQQLFVTGNHRALGNWRPDAIPLTRMGENAWSGQAVLPVSDTLEYKLTRGSWDTEAVLPDGTIPGNHEIKAGGDAAARHTVAAWKDQFE